MAGASFAGLRQLGQEISKAEAGAFADDLKTQALAEKKATKVQADALHALRVKQANLSIKAAEDAEKIRERDIADLDAKREILVKEFGGPNVGDVRQIDLQPQVGDTGVPIGAIEPGQDPADFIEQTVIDSQEANQVAPQSQVTAATTQDKISILKQNAKLLPATKVDQGLDVEKLTPPDASIFASMDENEKFVAAEINKVAFMSLRENYLRTISGVPTEAKADAMIESIDIYLKNAHSRGTLDQVRIDDLTEWKNGLRKIGQESAKKQSESAKTTQQKNQDRMSSILGKPIEEVVKLDFLIKERQAGLSDDEIEKDMTQAQLAHELKFVTVGADNKEDTFRHINALRSVYGDSVKVKHLEEQAIIRWGSSPVNIRQDPTREQKQINKQAENLVKEEDKNNALPVDEQHKSPIARAFDSRNDKTQAAAIEAQRILDDRAKSDAQRASDEKKAATFATPQGQAATLATNRIRRGDNREAVASDLAKQASSLPDNEKAAVLEIANAVRQGKFPSEKTGPQVSPQTDVSPEPPKTVVEPTPQEPFFITPGSTSDTKPIDLSTAPGITRIDDRGDTSGRSKTVSETTEGQRSEQPSLEEIKRMDIDQLIPLMIQQNGKDSAEKLIKQGIQNATSTEESLKIIEVAKANGIEIEFADSKGIKKASKEEEAARLKSETTKFVKGLGKSGAGQKKKVGDWVIRPGLKFPFKIQAAPQLFTDARLATKEEIDAGNKQAQKDRDIQDVTKFVKGLKSGVSKDTPKKKDKEKEFTTYTVKKGDTLGKIAKRLLGRSRRFKDIFKANKDILSDPDSIKPGQVLKIPKRK